MKFEESPTLKEVKKREDEKLNKDGNDFILSETKLVLTRILELDQNRWNEVRAKRGAEQVIICICEEKHAGQHRDEPNCFAFECVYCRARRIINAITIK